MKAPCCRPGCDYELEVLPVISGLHLEDGWRTGADGVWRRARRRGSISRRLEDWTRNPARIETPPQRQQRARLLHAARTGVKLVFTVPVTRWPLRWECPACRTMNTVVSSRQLNP